MKTPSSAVKIFTVAGFFLLMASFVGYKAGLFRGMMSDDDTPAADTTVVEDDLDIMPSTKSAPMGRNFFDSEEDSVQEETQQEMMGGSKSDQIFTPEPELNQAAEPMILPSSKSGKILPPNNSKSKMPKQQRDDQ